MDPSKSQFTVSDDRTSFRAKRVAAEDVKSQFYPKFRRSNFFRAKGLCFVAPRWHCPAPQGRNRKEEEGARGQESKRAREQEGKGEKV